MRHRKRDREGDVLEANRKKMSVRGGISAVSNFTDCPDENWPIDLALPKFLVTLQEQRVIEAIIK